MRRAMRPVDTARTKTRVQADAHRCVTARDSVKLDELAAEDRALGWIGVTPPRRRGATFGR